jgi:hypothetical protein
VSYDQPMQVSDVRRRIRAAIDAARIRAAERRSRTDEASRAYDVFLETIAVPAFHTVTSALTGEGHRFKVITPGRAVRMSSERSPEDFIELALDTERDAPAVVIVTSRGRGRRMVSTERLVREDLPIAELAEEDVVAALLEELLPFIER